jgi:hypothetical protein
MEICNSLVFVLGEQCAVVVSPANGRQLLVCVSQPVDLDVPAIVFAWRMIPSCLWTSSPAFFSHAAVRSQSA